MSLKVFSNLNGSVENPPIYSHSRAGANAVALGRVWPSRAAAALAVQGHCCGEDPSQLLVFSRGSLQVVTRKTEQFMATQTGHGTGKCLKALNC